MQVNLRTTKRGSAAGRSGLRGEHLRILLEDADESSFGLFADVLDFVPNAQIPNEIKHALALGALTPLNKLDDAGQACGIRGFAQGIFCAD